jgi:hypothetical protein
MPDVTRIEVGRRLYRIHKGKNVEQAVSRARETLGRDWKAFSGDDVRLLERMLGEAWVNMEQKGWDRIPFAHMTMDDIRRIIAIGKGLEADKSLERADLDKLKKILSGLA